MHRIKELPDTMLQKRSFSPLALFQVILACFTLQPGLSGSVEIGTEALLPEDPSQLFARYVRFRPIDGAEVGLNPPRMSWPCLPGIRFQDSAVSADRSFTLQIADNPGFVDPVVEIKRTPYNFYNFLPPLDKSKEWYWRIGYHAGGQPVQWSDTRQFAISADAVEWDRSNFSQYIDRLEGHPRILFNHNNYQQMVALQHENEFSKAYAVEIIQKADGILKRKDYKDFPKDDSKKMNYMQFSDALVHLGFAYILTGDEKYAGFRERALTMASWPPGGHSSPEGNGQSLKWQTHITEHLGMLYDWFFDDWSQSERDLIRPSMPLCPLWLSLG